MAFSSIDRTSEVETAGGEIQINSSDYCRYFEKHPYTLLQRKECWTCRYSDFGIETGSVGDTGVCRFHKL